MQRSGGLGNKFRREEQKVKISQLKSSDLKVMAKYLKKYRFLIAGLGIITILLIFFDLLPPYFSRFIIDNSIKEKNINNLIFYSSLFIISYFFHWIFVYLQTRFGVWLGQKIVYGLREEINDHILYQSMEFHSKNKKGELLSIITNDVNAIEESITTGVINTISDLFTIIGVVIFMMLMSVKLTLISLIISPCIYFILSYLGKSIRKAFAAVRMQIARLNANVEENMSGIRVVKALVAEKRNRRDFEDISEMNFQANMKTVHLFAMLFSIMSILNSISIILLLGFGGYWTIKGVLSIGVLVAFLQYNRKLFAPLRDLSQVVNIFQSAAASIIRIAGYLNTPIKLKDSLNPVKIEFPVDGNLKIRDIDFQYESVPLFSQFNLNVKSGEKIGIVGETGAGKSTLINLITRLYEIKKGSILIDSYDIRQIKNSDLRKIISLVSQNPILFADSILNNIRFGNPGATDEEVINAAKLTQVHDVVQKFPDKYDTILGEEGIGLSGGQKQLIAYTRMVLADPVIVILDEATANLDSYTENIIQENMKKLLREKTTLIIAHRFATLQIVDRIIVLDKGKLIAEGPHDVLLNDVLYYKELYERQFVGNR